MTVRVMSVKPRTSGPPGMLIMSLIFFPVSHELGTFLAVGNLTTLYKIRPHVYLKKIGETLCVV